MKKALITGITGQTGSMLAELLLQKGYEVSGIIRRSSSFNTGRIDPIRHNLKLFYGDLTDSTNLIHVIQQIQPDEIFHLAAQSHVKISFEIPEYTANVDAVGTLRILEAVRILGLESKVKIYNATTSELYGLVQEIPQTETTPFYPRSPYGVAKLYSYWICKNYREAYNMFICNGILFNHESSRRTGNFVTKKITDYVNIMKEKYDLEDIQTLKLGNLNAKRDWGYARDYVEAMYLMLQHDKPDDYIVATNEAHSVREFCEEAFKYIGVDLMWEGEGLKEKGIDEKTNKVLIEVDDRYFRPTEVDLLIGSYDKIKNTLGWEPKIKFKELVKLMIDGD